MADDRTPPSWRDDRTPTGPDPGRDLDEEFRFHLDLRVAEYVARGLAPDEARRRALRRFGDPTELRAETLRIDQRRHRREARADLMHALRQDLRDALRTIRRTPALSFVVTVTLALGVGAATAIYSVVDAVLLRPLPYATPERLVALGDRQPTSPDVLPASFPEYLDWKQRSGEVFDEVAAWFAAGAALTGHGDPERLLGERISSNLPALLGIQPLIGRLFTPAEEQPSAERVVLISERLWRRRFNASPSILGQALTLNGEPYTVIGVFPAAAGARLPNELRSGRQTDYWAPLRLTTENASRGLHFMNVAARLRPGVSLAQAQGRMTAIAAQLRDDGVTRHDVQVHALSDRVAGDARAPLVLLAGSVLMLMLIACANVANLLLARLASRQREFGIRIALGASRPRLLGQLLSESVVRAIAGGAAGVAVAYGGLWVTRRLLAVSLPRFEQVAIDGRVLGFTLGLSIFTGVLFGIVPGLRAARGSPRHLLGESSRTVHGSLTRDRFRRALIVGEVALSFVLLAGAGLLLRSFHRLTTVPLGFEPARTLTSRIDLPDGQYPDSTRQRAFYAALVAAVTAIPGVEGAALTSHLPIEGGTNGSVAIEGREFPPGQGPMAEKRIVSHQYLQVIGSRLVAGRLFDARDREGAAPVVVVNEAFVRQWLDGKEPIGARVDFQWGTDGWQTIAGVIADVREVGLDRPVPPAIYIPVEQRAVDAMYLVVRSALGAESLVRGLRERLGRLDATVPLSELRTLDDVLRADMADQRLSTSILGTFAGLALVLAMIGVYGVISYSVAQRGQELGVRAALGARRGDLLGLVVRQGLSLVGAGLAIGAVSAIGFGQVMANQLFGVGPRDPLTFAIVGLVMAVVAMSATLLPALRATRADPLVALRQD